MSHLRMAIIALGSAGAISACGTAVPQQLTTARQAYRDAAAGPALSSAPADLKTAEQALGRAERSFIEDGASADTIDLAYIAQRRAQIATAVANRQRAEDEKTRYEKERSDISDEMRRAAVDDLKTAQADLGRTEGQVSAEQAARLAAERKTVTANAETAKAKAETDKAKAETDKMRAALIRAGQLAENERGLVITLNSGVLFRSGRSTVLPAAGRKLAEVAALLRGSPDRRVIVEGHTDTDGDDANNQVLSQARADSVRAFLVAQGVAAGSVSAVGYGEGRSIATNATVEGRANNRRVEIVMAPLPAAKL
jgi:outer membrane protein OmpA-like peptidoglycan-associated protein